MTTTRRIVRIAGMGMLLLGGWAAPAAAQPKVLTLDNVPKKQVEETFQKAPADQVFEFKGSRMTKAEVIAKATANHERFVAGAAAARPKMTALTQSAADHLAQSAAARKAELEAANAKGSAELAAGIAAARKAE